MPCVPLVDLLTLCGRWRRRGETIAVTNGCFDLLHPGHVYALRAARQLCRRLIVAVNSDESVRLLKGSTRPIQPAWLRADLAGLVARADAVTIFEESTPARLLREVRPDLLIKGGDYTPSELAGGEFAGRIVLIPRLPEFSTTACVRQIQAAASAVSFHLLPAGAGHQESAASHPVASKHNWPAEPPDHASHPSHPDATTR